MEKLIITAAIVGSHTHKGQTAFLPVTPEEVAEEAFRAYQAGAAIIHLHPKDPDPDKSDVEVLGETIKLIRQKCDAIIQVGTGQIDRFHQIRSLESRLELLNIDPKPEMDTVNAGSFHFRVLSRSAKLKSFLMNNPPELIEALVKGMVRQGIHIEFEVYDIGQIGNITQLIADGILPADYSCSFNFVMGIGGAIPPTPKCLMYLIEQLPPGAKWTVSGIGKYQYPLITMAIILGGHVRVGLEDNIYVSKGVYAQGNAELVAKAVRIAKELDREVASVAEAKEILRM